MQWMFVEMNNMKHEMKQMHKKIDPNNASENRDKNSSILANNLNSYNIG